jgi:hypothetical protein
VLIVAREMAWWRDNNTTNCTTGDVPYEALFRTSSLLPGIRDYRRHTTRENSAPQKPRNVEYFNSALNPFRVGDKVYVKSSPSCTKPWVGPRTVTGVPTSISVELDDSTVPRHVSHVRKYPCEPRSGSANIQSSADTTPVGAAEVVWTHAEVSSDNYEQPEEETDWTHEDTLRATDEEPDFDPESSEEGRTRPIRNRRPPSYLRDYDVTR